MTAAEIKALSDPQLEDLLERVLTEAFSRGDDMVVNAVSEHMSMDFLDQLQARLP